MRALAIVLLGVALGGCSLYRDSEIVRLDGQTASAVEVEGARASCSEAEGDVCLAALGYGAVSKDRAARAQGNLQRIAEDNQRERQRLALAAEMERKKQLTAAAKKKKQRTAQHNQQQKQPQQPQQAPASPWQPTAASPARQPTTTGDSFGRRYQ